MIPWDDKWGEAPTEIGHRGIAKLALAQVLNVKQESPQTAIGGQLMIAELSRFGMYFSMADDLSKGLRESA